MVIAENVFSFLILVVVATALYLVQYWKNRALKVEKKNSEVLVDAILKEAEKKVMLSDIDALVDLGNELYNKSGTDTDNKPK